MEIWNSEKSEPVFNNDEYKYNEFDISMKPWIVMGKDRIYAYQELKFCVGEMNKLGLKEYNLTPIVIVMSP
jgi:hypothetical protein